MVLPAYYIKEFQKVLKANGFEILVDGYFGGDTRDTGVSALTELARLRLQTGSFTNEDRATMARIEAGQKREEVYMSTYKEEVERIIPKLEAQTLANAAILQLVTSFVTQLRDLSNDPNSENVDALADAWESSLGEVQGAVVANTAAAAEPIVEAPAPTEE